jgi:uncharacterized protein with HEPN domain
MYSKLNNSKETNQLFLLQSLNDIIEICDELELNILFVCQTFDEFVSEAVHCSATERCFSIISETTNRVHEVNSNIDIKYSENLIILMNKSYCEIEPIDVWNILQNDIQNLKKEIEEIISSLKH